MFLDRAAIREEVHSPLWQAGLYRPPEAGRDALVDPAKLARGLARVAEERGVAIHERTRVTSVERRAGGVDVRTAEGPVVRAGHVVVATSAYSGWLRRLSSHFVPVYDYALVSEPLTPDQRAAVGWRRRQGMSDGNNQFHYFRLTADDRILWGGYDAVYYRGNGIGPEFDRRPATTDKLEAQFRAAFPQLGDARVPVPLGRRDRHDHAVHGHVRPGARRAADVRPRLHRAGRRREPLGGRRSSGTSSSAPTPTCSGCRFVQTPPIPFPPEPFRSVAVNAVRWELDRADRNEGRRGMLLRTLDALGIGFDS